jgi:hypothetical protein
VFQILSFGKIWRPFNEGLLAAWARGTIEKKKARARIHKIKDLFIEP